MPPPASSARSTECAACHCLTESAILCLNELSIANDRRNRLLLCHNLVQDPVDHWLNTSLIYRTLRAPQRQLLLCIDDNYSCVYDRKEHLIRKLRRSRGIESPPEAPGPPVMTSRRTRG
jgi:hypothetical protein